MDADCGVRLMLSWGYVAGYFDGEGNVGCHLTKSGARTQALSWFNTHLESLEEIQHFIGCGSVRPRRVSKLGTKPSYVLAVNRKLDILRVLEHMEPLLLIKRAQAVRLREHLISNVDETRYENHGKVTSLSDEEMLRLYNDEHLSFQGIADRLGVCAAAVAHSFKLRGLKARPVGAFHATGSKLPESTVAKMRETRQRLWADPVWAERQREMMRQPRVRGIRRQVS